MLLSESVLYHSLPSITLLTMVTHVSSNCRSRAAGCYWFQNIPLKQCPLLLSIDGQTQPYASAAQCEACMERFGHSNAHRELRGHWQ